ncbi:MAG TPA: hypothetical protein VIJ16_10595 [Gemmatimonadaceae bacterium]
MTVLVRRLAAVLLVSLGAQLKAQGRPLAPMIEQLPGGTRSLGMANADLAGRESDVMFYNPAQLAVARGSGASAEFYQRGDLLTGLSTVLDVGQGAVGLGVQSLTFTGGASGYASPSVLGTSGTLPGTGVELVTGYAQSLMGYRVGVNAKLVEQEIGATRDTRGALDVGAARDLLNGTASLSVQNVGPQMRTTLGPLDQPARVNLGYTSRRLEAGPLDLTGAASVAALRDRTYTAGAGGEASYSWIDGYAIAARAGVRQAAEGEGPWTVGLGISADRFTLDYAFESRDHRPGAHRIGVRIR